ncbi:hypothetical protein D9M71_784350 [compost metagenome]
MSWSCCSMPLPWVSSSWVYWAAAWRHWSLRWVYRCMRLVLSQTKKGLSACCALRMKSCAMGITSAPSKSSMRFMVSGPVSSMVCLPTRPKRGSSVGSSLSLAKVCSTPRVWNFLA